MFPVSANTHDSSAESGKGTVYNLATKRLTALRNSYPQLPPCNSMFKNLTNLASAMKNMTQIGSQLKSLNDKLEGARVYGTASTTGMIVNVEMSGLGIVQSVSVSDKLMVLENKQILEQLTKDAVNQAIKSAKEMHIRGFRDLTGGVELFPGLNEMLENMAK